MARFSDAAAQEWDRSYREHEHRWSGHPNRALVQEVSDLPPGLALDVGCGEGADAVWLASQGWSVLGIDISKVALDRASQAAQKAGVNDRVRWEHHDFRQSFPEGEFDLVSVFFVHTKDEAHRDDAIRGHAAALVKTGGVLLIVNHTGTPPWNPDAGEILPSANEVLTGMGLDMRSWEVLTVKNYPPPGIDKDAVGRLDSTVKLRRL